MKASVLFLTLALLLGCRKGTEVAQSEAASADSRSMSLASIQSFVDSQLSGLEDSRGPLYSIDGHCLYYSELWFQLFKDAGMKVALQQTVGVYYPKVRGKAVQRTPTHFFLAVNPGSQNEIIIDPTFGQFFSGAARLKLTPVLVATKDELIRIYQKDASSLRMQVAGDEHVGEYDPREFAEMIYSFGNHSKTRTNLGY